MKRSILAAALLVALTADARASSSVGGPDPAARHPFFVKPIRIVAHRGGVALAPENTLEAFRAVVERWPDAVIESDVRLTSDAVPVLLHDPTVDRTTDGTGEVARLSLVALQAYDAGYRFSPDGGRTFPSRGHGVRVPTLEATLRALPGTRFEIELKEGTDAVPAVVGAVRNANATERVLLVSPRAEVLARIRALAPAIATNLDEASAHALVTALRSGSRPAAPPAGQLLTADPRQLADAGIGRADIAALARVGVPVQAFTIDDAGEMRRLLDLGVTSLVTNRPDLVADLGDATPPAGPASRPRGASPALARTLVVLGDSIGDPPPGTSAYAALLGADLKRVSPGARVLRAARSGARSRDLPGQVAALPTSLPGPAAVVITIGGNDLREATPAVILGADQEPRAALVRNVGAALDELLRPGRFAPGIEVRVFLATIYDSSDGRGGFRELGCPIPLGKLDTTPFFARWNEDLRKVAAARGVEVIDLHQLFRGHGLGAASPWYLRDCIHPNDTGHAEIARAFGSAMGVTSSSPASDGGAAASAAPVPPPAPPTVATGGEGIHEGAFEVRLKSGSAFKVRRYADRGDTIEVKRSGLAVTIRKSEIAAITAVD